LQFYTAYGRLLDSQSNSQLVYSNAYDPLPAGTDDVLDEDHFTSTRDCLISRTPGQHLLFQQMIADFKESHPSLSILLIFPVANSRNVITDMTDQLIQLSEIFDHRRLFVSFGIGESKNDESYHWFTEASKALEAGHVYHRVQSTPDISAWTQRTLLGHMVDFEVAVVLDGIVCAIDLARLIIHTIDNGADMACAVDVRFSPQHIITSNSGNLDRTTGALIPVDTLLYSRHFIQSSCCDGPVKVFPLKAFARAGLLHFLSERKTICPNENPFASICACLHKSSKTPPKVMISPSVKSSFDREDFRSALQLGFMGLQGYDYRSIAWKETRLPTSDVCY
jgi:hypothetical protein